MNRHSLHYLELNRAEEKAPPVWAQVLGAVVTLAALWAVTVFLFSL